MGYIRPEVNKLTKSQRDTIIRKGKSFNINVETWRINDHELLGELLFRHDTGIIPIPISLGYFDDSIQVIKIFMKFLPFEYKIKLNVFIENEEERKNLNEKLDHVMKFIEWLKSYDEKIVSKKVKENP